MFGAKGGEAFVDSSNCLYLYLYTVAERDRIRAVWLSRNDDVVLELAEGAYLSDRTDEPWAIVEFLSRLCVHSPTARSRCWRAN